MTDRCAQPALAVVAAMAVVHGAGYASPPSTADIESRVSEYIRLAKSIIRQAVRDELDLDEAARSADRMVDIGLEFCHLYSDRFPRSAPMMQLVTDAGDRIRDLSIDEIEHDWHEGAVFRRPGVDLGFDIDDESVESFHDPLDAVVHPATALAVLREYRTAPDEASRRQLLAMLKAELQEVIEHAQQVATTLTLGDTG